MNYLTNPTTVLGVFTIAAGVAWKFGYASDTDVTLGLILMVGILVLSELEALRKK